MMRRAKVDYLDKADMMGHKSPAPNEGSYERYIEQDFERFPEYQKAIPLLTISDEQRSKVELELKKQEIAKLEEKEKENNRLQDRVKSQDKRLAKLEQMLDIRKHFQ